MSRPTISAILRGYDVDWLGNSAVEPPIGRKPIETCLKESMRQPDDDNVSEMALHSIRFRGHFLNHHSLIIAAPSLHPFVGANDRRYVIDNILLLSAFVVEGYLLSCQRLESGANAELGATSYT
jgi:hypothetical protein